LRTACDLIKLHGVLVSETGCWLWTKGKYRDGYGTIWFRGKNWRAHRYFYTVIIGEIPPRKHLLHVCDVPACVNPSHLFVGTNKDNVNDKVTKKRQARWETSGRAKLTNDNVRDIRHMILSGDRVVDIAAKFSVSQCNISHIKNGKSWRGFV
jgi:hypothetical protein